MYADRVIISLDEFPNIKVGQTLCGRNGMKAQYAKITGFGKAFQSENACYAYVDAKFYVPISAVIN